MWFKPYKHRVQWNADDVHRAMDGRQSGTSDTSDTSVSGISFRFALRLVADKLEDADDRDANQLEGATVACHVNIVRALLAKRAIAVALEARRATLLLAERLEAAPALGA